MKKSFTEIDEGWSQRDVNLMLHFLEVQALASEPDDRAFLKSIANLYRQEAR